jgi:myo-inositol-1(or 4)-monophosphatase
VHPFINTAVRAARQAGTIIARAFPHVDTLTIDTKQRNDFVSDVDRAAEKEIISTIRKAYPHHAFWGEESGRSSDDGIAEFEWIIDPLDGTTNFLHGFPHFAISIAMLYRGRLDQAVIYNPISQELYTATRGEGAQLDGRRIRVSKRRGLEGALLGTGFPFKNDAMLEPFIATFRAFYGDTAGIRRPGSAALDLAYVAAGRIDGFWEFDLNPWDIAAGCLLVQEAGGKVGDFAGGDRYLESGNIIAANLRVFDAMLERIRPVLPPGITC